jgi:hypothetical protein
MVAAAVASAIAGAASKAVQLLNDKFYAWWAKEKSVDKKSSNLDSSNDSDAASIDDQLAKIVQFFSRELEKVHHDHAAVVATLNASNDAANAAISAKDAQINTLININGAKDAQINTLINSNAVLIKSIADSNAALVSYNAALIDIVKNNRPGWFQRVNTGNARAPVGTTKNQAEVFA